MGGDGEQGGSSVIDYTDIVIVITLTGMDSSMLTIELQQSPRCDIPKDPHFSKCTPLALDKNIFSLDFDRPPSRPSYHPKSFQDFMKAPPSFHLHISSQTPTDSPLAHLPLTSISTTLSSSYVTTYNGDFSFRFFTSFAFTISRGGSGTKVDMGLTGGKDNND